MALAQQSIGHPADGGFPGFGGRTGISDCRVFIRVWKAAPQKKSDQNTDCFARATENPWPRSLLQVMPVLADVQVKGPKLAFSP